MKKYLIALISVMMLLPMAVHADVTSGFYTTNNHVMVGGYKEINIFGIEGNKVNLTLREINIEYDPNYFSITKDDITVMNCAYETINKNDIIFTSSNGKISIKSTKDVASEYCHATWTFKIHLDFLALKSGKSDIKLNGLYIMDDSPISTTITEPICPKCEEKECPTVEEKECPVCEENECPKCVTEKSSTNGKSILIMVCSFLIGAALATMIFLIIKNKSKKE